MASYAAGISPVITTTAGSVAVSSFTANTTFYFSLDTSSATNGNPGYHRDDSNNVLGAFYGNPVAVVGVSSSALAFDGTTADFVNFDKNALVAAAGDYVYWEAFVSSAGSVQFPTGAPLREIIISADSVSSVNDGMLYVSSATRFAGARIENTLGAIDISSGPLVMDGSFHHIAFAKRGASGGLFELYVDGVLVSSKQMDRDYPISASARTARIASLLSGDEFFGIIDEASAIMGPNSTDIPTSAGISDRAVRYAGGTQTTTLSTAIKASQRIVPSAAGSAIVR